MVEAPKKLQLVPTNSGTSARWGPIAGDLVCRTFERVRWSRTAKERNYKQVDSDQKIPIYEDTLGRIKTHHHPPGHVLLGPLQRGSRGQRKRKDLLGPMGSLISVSTTRVSNYVCSEMGRYTYRLLRKRRQCHARPDKRPELRRWGACEG